MGHVRGLKGTSTLVAQSSIYPRKVLNNANKQSGVTVPSNALKLSSCLVAAGSDTAKIQACAAQHQRPAALPVHPAGRCGERPLLGSDLRGGVLVALREQLVGTVDE